MQERTSPLVWVALAVSVCAGGAVGMLFAQEYRETRTTQSRLTAVEAKLDALLTDHASTTAELEARIAETEHATTRVSDLLYAEQQRIDEAEDRLGGFSKDVRRITGSVSTLEKLAKTDPELLQKYSKIFFLNEHYTPERLVEIPSAYRYHDERVERIHADVWPFLEDLIEEALEDGIKLFVKSGYRSFDEQANIKSAFSVTYGAGTANTFSADQGYSEHQLGTTVDFITTGLDGQLSGFGATDAFEWLKDNAYRFGFVLSYPEGNAYYIYEPWHWRFVGKELAKELRRNKQHFYDMEQRDIDGYLVTLFD